MLGYYPILLPTFIELNIYVKIYSHHFSHSELLIQTENISRFWRPFLLLQSCNYTIYMYLYSVKKYDFVNRGYQVLTSIDWIQQRIKLIGR